MKKIKIGLFAILFAMFLSVSGVKVSQAGNVADFTALRTAMGANSSISAINSR